MCLLFSGRVGIFAEKRAGKLTFGAKEAIQAHFNSHVLKRAYEAKVERERK